MIRLVILIVLLLLILRHLAPVLIRLLHYLIYHFKIQCIISQVIMRTKCLKGPVGGGPFSKANPNVSQDMYSPDLS